MKRLTSAIGVCVLLLALTAAHGADVPATAIPPSIQGYGDHNTSCAAWTDDCVTCERKSEAEFVCSNIGNACQPKDIRCVRQQGTPPAAPEQK